MAETFAIFELFIVVTISICVLTKESHFTDYYYYKALISFIGVEVWVEDREEKHENTKR